MPENAWLTIEHPLYQQKRDEWLTNERRMRGGAGVLCELQRFDWETGQQGIGFDRTQEFLSQEVLEAKLFKAKQEAGSLAILSHYATRQLRAMYVNFPEAFAALLIGHLMRQSPEKDASLNFGTLGEVKRKEGETIPTRAEQMWYNCDGVGNDGSQWDAFWTSVGKWSMATGHRWVMVEASRTAPATRADELNGRRPYLVHYSPLDITNWHFDEGKLRYAVIRFRYRDPTISEKGQMEGNQWLVGRRLLVAQGWAGFGTAYAGGGWWDFKADGTPFEGRSGDWSKTLGEIPMWVHYYERDRDELSRSGAFELGQAATAYMNTASAADYDAWDAAQSITYVLGATEEGFNLAAKKYQDGAKLIPVPMNEDSKSVPGIYDGSAGAVASLVFTNRLEGIRAVTKEIAALEASGGPDASGLAKQMGFLDGKSPRLRLLASEFENSQNTAIRFLELRFGPVDGTTNVQPFGSVTWPRDFDLKPVLDGVKDYLDIQTASGVVSPVMTARALVRAGEQTGLVTDDDDSDLMEKEIQTEIEAGAADAARQSAALDLLARQQPPPGPTPPGPTPPGPTPPNPPPPPPPAA